MRVILYQLLHIQLDFDSKLCSFRALDIGFCFMAYKGELITHQLRAVREAAGISQRELSARSGLTQSHISQIERGATEPGLSSLIDVARALELELILVPKKLVPAVRGIVRTSAPEQVVSLEAGKSALTLIERGERLLATQKVKFGGSADLDRIVENLRFLRQAPLQSADLVLIRDAVNQISLFNAVAHPEVLQKIARDLQALRNQVVHDTSELPRAAYSVDDEDDDG
jgi:transcriptional regulator with XRE-family HTH domain